MHTVIVGSGAAGVKAALELSRRRLGKITLVSNESYFVHREALYQAATGRDIHGVAIPLEDIFAQDHDVEIVRDTMKSIDVSSKSITCTKEVIMYDTLIIAIGSVANYFGVHGKRSAFGLQSLEQVRAFKRHIHDEVVMGRKLDTQYVVVGAGFTGAELAGSLRGYVNEVAQSHGVKAVGDRIHVTLVELRARVLPGASHAASKKVTRQLRQLGVKVITGRKVESLSDKYVVVDGKRVPAEAIMWTSDSANNPFFAHYPQEFALAKDGNVVVNGFLEAREDVFVLGDGAVSAHGDREGSALRQAEFVARHLQRKMRGKRLRPYRVRPVMVNVRIGDRWAYMEAHGVYAAGRVGYYLYRLHELICLRAVLPYTQAKSAWLARNARDDDCDLCDI